jgi:hypothetical protein
MLSLVSILFIFSSWSNKVTSEEIKCLVSSKKFSNEYLFITESQKNYSSTNIITYPSSKINKFSDIEFIIKHIEAELPETGNNDYNYFYKIEPYDEYYILNDKKQYLCSSDKFHKASLTRYSSTVKLNEQHQYRLIESRNRLDAIDLDECKWRFERKDDNTFSLSSNSFTVWNIYKNETLYAASQLVKYNKRKPIRNVYLLPSHLSAITNMAEQFKWKFDCNIPNIYH